MRRGRNVDSPPPANRDSTKEAPAESINDAGVFVRRLPEAERRDHHLLDKWRRLYAQTADADDWQTVHRWEDDDYPVEAANDVREKLQFRGGERVLEVGCASGRFLSLVFDGMQRGVALDHCEAVLRRGVEFLGTRAMIALAAADAAHLPVSTASFDRVISYSVFQCFPSSAYAASVLRELIRVCKPGGFVLVGDIFGVMEKPRRALSRAGIPAVVADCVLWPFRPLWHLKQHPGSRGDGLQRRSYTRGFFRKIAKIQGCSLEFLLQNIPQREHSKARFDVRIFKPIAGA